MKFTLKKRKNNGELFTNKQMKNNLSSLGYIETIYEWNRYYETVPVDFKTYFKVLASSYGFTAEFRASADEVILTRRSYSSGLIKYDETNLSNLCLRLEELYYKFDVCEYVEKIVKKKRATSNQGDYSITEITDEASWIHSKLMELTNELKEATDKKRYNVITVEASWTFDVDVEDYDPECVNVANAAIEDAVIELNELIENGKISVDDFEFNVTERFKE